MNNEEVLGENVINSIYVISENGSWDFWIHNVKRRRCDFDTHGNRAEAITY